MTDDALIEPQGLEPSREGSESELPFTGPGLLERCTKAYLQSALGHFEGVEVSRASVNRSGRFVAAKPTTGMPGVADEVIVDDLPDFCDVEVLLTGPGGHVARIAIWVPIAWNGRFMGTAGGGLRTEMPFGLPPYLRAMTMDFPLRRGFATAKTDGANRKPQPAAWGLLEGTDQIDWPLTESWIHRSTHDMTVVAKAVIEALHGRPPRFSYLIGCSGGGRQALVTAQRYPEDYDGIWSSDPAINLPRMVLSEIWPALVMKEAGNPLPPAKLEAFRSAAIAACDGLDGLRDGVIGAFDPLHFDARSVIGTVTDAGPLTALDAEVMTRIWQGPHTSAGEFLWYGLRPGTESWGRNLLATGLCETREVDGKYEILPADIAVGFIQAWVVRDLAWDWKTLTFDQYEQFYQLAGTELASLGSDDPDLSSFRAAGGKIIISHGANDQLIPPEGTIQYYGRVIDALGSEKAVRSFARLFITEGDGHALFTETGPGLLLEDGIEALLNWVEKNEAPEEITARRMDFATRAELANRPVYAYPNVPQYRGEGDPLTSAAFMPVPLSSRLPRS